MKKLFVIVPALVLIGLFLTLNNASRIFAGSCAYTGAGGGNWATGGNWTGTCVGTGGAPGTNDDISIPSATSTNNNIVGLTLNSITFTGTPGGTLTGNELSIVTSIDNSGPPNPHIINLDIILAANVSLSTNSYNGTIDLNGNDIIAAPTVLPWGIAGDVTGSGDIIINDGGDTVILGGAVSYTGSIGASGNTVLQLDGSGWDSAEIALGDGATYTGNAVIDSIITDGTNILRPNDGSGNTGFIQVVNSVGLQAGDTVSIFIAGNFPNGNDVITASGGTEEININNATLSLSLDGSYIHNPGDIFTIIDATTVTGIFTGLPDGLEFSIGGDFFRINYSGASVTLTSIAYELFNSGFTANPSNPTAGEAVTITSTWTSTGPTPTGTAELFDGTTSLGTVSLVGGVATFNIASGFTAGTHTLTVEYSGDGIFAGAISSPLVLGVSAVLADTGINMPVSLIAALLLMSSGSLAAFKKRK